MEYDVGMVHIKNGCCIKCTTLKYIELTSWMTSDILTIASFSGIWCSSSRDLQHLQSV